MRRGPIAAPGPAAGLRIGLFGGSFNPAHAGHRHVAETALRRLDLDWIWWIVALGNPLKDKHGSFPARLASARRVAAHPRMRASDMEAQLAIVYSAQLIEALSRRFPTTRFVWIMGADNLASFHKWRNWRRMMSTIPIAVVARPGAGAKARHAKAFGAFARARTRSSQSLWRADAPAWTYLSAPLDLTSSTALRRRAARRNPFRRP